MLIIRNKIINSYFSFQFTINLRTIIMTKDQEAFYGMALKVKNFNAKNAASMTAVPAVAGFYTQLNTLIAQLVTADVGSRADLTGYAISKSVKRTSLETLSLKVSNALSSYAVVNNDAVLQKRADFPTSKWYLCSEEELVTQANIIKNLAAPLSTTLVSFGAAADDVTALETALTAFTDAISDPTLAIDQRKEDNEKIVGTIDQIRTLFTDKLDVLMRSFEVNNPSLFALYRSARAIDTNGSVMTPTAIVDVLANTTQTIHTATSYSPDTFYTIQNMSSEGVFFSLSATDGVEGEEKVVLASGETRSRIADNLAATGVYLVLTNPSAVPVKIRLWVE